VPDQAVGGLTVLLAEQALAVHDRGGTSRQREGSCWKDPLTLFGRVERRGTAGERRHKILWEVSETARKRGGAVSPTFSEWFALRAGKITGVLTLPDRF
jgi:hypothetical protein